MRSAGHDRLKRPGHNPLALALDIVPREAPGLVVRVLSRIRVLNRPTKPPSINGLTRHIAQHLSVDIIHWVAVRDADRSTRTRRPRFHGGAQRTSGSVPRILDGAAYSVPAKAWANTVRSASTVAHTQSGVV